MQKIHNVARFKAHGYNPIHVVGKIYLIRSKPKSQSKFSFYKLVKCVEAD